ncbi:MAG: orotidine-5'-phosphate decarboxylase [Treponema sp.]|jgi:orotidine-5'-phosphate decarboxylase|nr:orotidine-5'-phosphate decarboxylase [Treponema sp.]
MSQPVPAIDLLFESVKKKGHVCVGLDTSAEYVPPMERRKAQNDSEAVLSFNKALIDVTFDAAACFKVQIAYYEEMGKAGLCAYSETLKYIRSKGGIVITDIKRGDIADTALRYAKAHFQGDFEADFVTLSPYMGMDSIEPWHKTARNLGKGAFVLMRTSNPGMRDFEYLEIANSGGKRLYHAIGDKMSALADEAKGSHGYGLFGVVVGCTERDEAEEIRKNYPNLFFLIPGYGAQGGGAKDAALLLKNGNGGVVNASRSIITAWQKADKDIEKVDNNFAAQEAGKAAVKMRDEILAEV